MSKKQTPKVIPIEQVIAALLDNTQPFSPTYLHRFSDLSPADSKELKKIWSNIETERRAALISDLEDLNNQDTLVFFDEVSRIAIEDPDARVRSQAINLLCESDDNTLAPIFIKMMQQDSDEVVRATAASALGLFIYMGELEEIPAILHARVEDALLAAMKNKDSDLVHRRVLEALGFSSRDEVTALIEDAYHNKDDQWQASALFAMGRSADNYWEKLILQKLNADGEVQFEAARAAGELELDAARDPLLAMLDEHESLEEELRDVIIWSLSKIGGEDVRETLEKLLDETEDEEEIEFIQNALDNLEFTEGANSLNMFSIDPEDLDGLDDLFGEEDDDESKPISGISKN